MVSNSLSQVPRVVEGHLALSADEARRRPVHAPDVLPHLVSHAEVHAAVVAPVEKAGRPAADVVFMRLVLLNMVEQRKLRRVCGVAHQAVERLLRMLLVDVSPTVQWIKRSLRVYCGHWRSTSRSHLSAWQSGNRNGHVRHLAFSVAAVISFGVRTRGEGGGALICVRWPPDIKKALSNWEYELNYVTLCMFSKCLLNPFDDTKASLQWSHSMRSPRL